MATLMPISAGRRTLSGSDSPGRSLRTPTGNVCGQTCCSISALTSAGVIVTAGSVFDGWLMSRLGSPAGLGGGLGYQQRIGNLVENLRRRGVGGNSRDRLPAVSGLANRR